MYFLTFKKFGVSASMLFQNDNKYFPAANTDLDPVTGLSLGNYQSLDGRIFSPDDQNHILYVVQGDLFIYLFIYLFILIIFVNIYMISFL